MHFFFVSKYFDTYFNKKILFLIFDSYLQTVRAGSTMNNSTEFIVIATYAKKTSYPSFENFIFFRNA